jgi:hypothetical protein
MISLIPIFKIRKQKSNVQNDLIKAEADYETWYIDISSRVYKSWKDYIEKNTLPKCTMVFPKDGFYDADPSYPVTEDYSTVCLEIIDSYYFALRLALNMINIVTDRIFSIVHIRTLYLTKRNSTPRIYK